MSAARILRITLALLPLALASVVSSAQAADTVQAASECVAANSCRRPLMASNLRTRRTAWAHVESACAPSVGVSRPSLVR